MCAIIGGTALLFSPFLTVFSCFLQFFPGFHLFYSFSPVFPFLNKPDMSEVWRPCPAHALHDVVTFLALCLAGGGDWRWDVRVTNDAGPHLHIAIFVNTICLWNQLDPRRVCTGLSTLPTIEHRIVCCRVNITRDQDTVGWSQIPKKVYSGVYYF